MAQAEVEWKTYRYTNKGFTLTYNTLIHCYTSTAPDQPTPSPVRGAVGRSVGLGSSKRI